MFIELFLGILLIVLGICIFIALDKKLHIDYENKKHRMLLYLLYFICAFSGLAIAVLSIMIRF